MFEALQTFLAKYSENKFILAIAAAVVGAVLTKLVPFLWSAIGRGCGLVLRLLGGRYAHRSFKKHYLDWLVTSLRELKLTGVVAADEAKKPQLEQVFVTLRLDESRDRALSPLLEKIDLMLRELLESSEGLPLWQEVLSSRLLRKGVD